MRRSLGAPLSITRVALVIYVPLAVVALLWIRFWQDRSLTEIWWSREHLWRDIGLGAAVAAVTIVLSALLTDRFTWAEDLEREFSRFLGPLSRSSVILLAVLSGVAGEVFFRGALQPTLGLVLTSLLFGAVHVGPGRHFLPWTIFAILMGFVLGWLYTFTGNLLAPILSHFLINAINLWRIADTARKHPPATLFPTPEPPSSEPGPPLPKPEEDLPAHNNGSPGSDEASKSVTPSDL